MRSEGTQKNSNDKRIKRIIRLIAKGKTDAAVRLFEADDLEQIYEYGVGIGRERDLETAGKIFDVVTQLRPDSAEAWFNKGVVLQQIGRIEDATECYDRATRIDPDYVTAWYNKGANLSEMGRYQDAIKCYDETIRIDPYHTKAWLNKGFALSKLGKNEEAIKCYNEIIRIEPKDALAWNNKGAVLSGLDRYEDAIKCFDEAIRIDPNYAVAWNNKGGNLRRVGKYRDAIECHDEAIRINSRYARAWGQKGLALTKLGEHEEAIKCYDEAIKIDSNWTDAWFNKGSLLWRIERFGDALQCFNEVIKISPSDAEAWTAKGRILSRLGRKDEAIKSFDEALRFDRYCVDASYNKGITLLSTYCYDEAATELKRARDLLSAKGAKARVELIGSLILRAANGSELLSKLRSIDESYTDALNYRSLAELGTASLSISRSIESLSKEFEGRPIPDGAKRLLDSKAFCFSVLSKALLLEEVDLTGLVRAQDTFKECGLYALFVTAGVLAVFASDMRRYSGLDQVPPDVEEYLLQLLRTSYLLDGELTEQIKNRFTAKSLPLEPIPIEPEKVDTKLVSISDTENDWVRVCLVQLDFSLTKEFPYRLRQEKQVKRKVFDALDIARKESANIVCFPELSFAREWIEDIKKRYQNMMIVCGSFYDDSNRNVCKIIMNGAEYDYAKCYPSIFEEEDGTGMRCGDRIFVFQTKWGRIAVLNCIDFDKEYANVDSQDLDFVVNTRYDLDSEHGFQRRASICVDRPDGSRSSTFMLQVNAKRIEYDDSSGGEGTVIIGYEHKYRLARYRQDGLRPKDDIKYKIYQARREMLLMADLNIADTTRRRTKTGNWYIYDTRSWKKLKDKRIWP